MSLKRLSKIILIVALITLVFALFACSPKKEEEEQIKPTYPDSILGTEVSFTEEGATKIYATTPLNDYTQYLNDKNIENAMKDSDAIVIALNGVKAMVKGEYVDTAETTLTIDTGVLIPDAAEISKLAGKTVTGTTIQEIAASLGTNYTIYENKLVMFHAAEEAPLDTFDDYYTLEALFLQLTDAEEEDITNAFIDLPSLISNGKNSATYYTSSDLSLAVQTNIYYEELGENEGAASGPAIVAGEGESSENHTIVRVLNRQQICTAQFLAYDSTVKGGVQVAAGLNENGETLIATAAFNTTLDAAKTVNVFDTNGVKRMEIAPDAQITAPYRIMTGNFLKDTESELLLITSEKPDANNCIYFGLYSLSTGKCLKLYKLDCSFANGCEIQLSIRENSDAADGIIIYFREANVAFEGNSDDLEFKNTGLELPDNAAGVYASADAEQKYIVSLEMTEETENQSFVNVYDGEGNCTTIDVGFKENVYYSSLAEDDDEGYVDNCSFQHIRVDLGCRARALLNSTSNKYKFDSKVIRLSYSDYKFTAINTYIKLYNEKNVMLEPCFTHRWNSGFMNTFVDYTDDDGNHIYAAIGSSGNYESYVELGSSFDNGTYADGYLVMDKIRLYPLRYFVREMAAVVREDNTHFIGISPVHEQEICVDGSVGDYNVNMIKGFASFLITQYGSVENINERFGTSFASKSEIDAPRNQGRGGWDVISGSNTSAFAKMWILYCRNIVNKRIMEAYRETLLAGFAPETISSHQIPEGEAVSGLLGQADTRLSPVDHVMVCGTAYGSTRYGVFYTLKNNFVALAHNAGHNSIELGEYSAVTTDADTAYTQLKYLWENGVRVNHIIAFSDEQYAAEQSAIDKLQEENQPRPGYTKGTDNIVSVKQGETSYNIIEIGEGEETNGLLKSVTSDGNWEGTVYVVPFHAHIGTTNIRFTDDGNNVYTSKAITALQSGDQVEFTFDAAYTGEGSAKVKIEVYQADYLQTEATTEFEIGADLTSYRYVISNQITPENLTVVITFTADDDTKLTHSDITATKETESQGRKYFQGDDAYTYSVAHTGGITYDLLNREMK